MDETHPHPRHHFFIFFILGTLIIGGLTVYFTTRPQVAGVTSPSPQPPATVEVISAAPQALEPAQIINIEAGNFSFNLSEIKIKKGVPIRLILTNTEGFHDFVVDELNLQTQKIGIGATDTLDFVADQTGTFEFYCSVGQHRQMGMTGNFIVED